MKNIVKWYGGFRLVFLPNGNVCVFTPDGKLQHEAFSQIKAEHWVLDHRYLLQAAT